MFHQRLYIALLITILLVVGTSSSLVYAFQSNRNPRSAGRSLSSSYPEWALPPKHNKASSTQLFVSVPPTAWWALGHVVGGSTGTPLVTQATQTWYRKIDLPSWLPPDRIFGPVWVTLYSCMGIAAGRIYRATAESTQQKLMAVWGLHCVLNVLWAPMFFGLQRLRAGFWISMLSITSLLWIIPAFYQIQPVASFLLLPYLAWLIFATFLNKEICKRNPTKQGYNNAMLQAGLCRLQSDAAKYAGVEWKLPLESIPLV